jgi:hypothetical protein
MGKNVIVIGAGISGLAAAKTYVGNTTMTGMLLSESVGICKLTHPSIFSFSMMAMLSVESGMPRGYIQVSSIRRHVKQAFKISKASSLILPPENSSSQMFHCLATDAL